MSDYVCSYYMPSRLVPKELKLQPPLKLVTKKKSRDFIMLPRIYKGSLFIYPYGIDDQDQLVAFEENTLKEKWSVSGRGDDLFYSELTFFDDTVIIQKGNKLVTYDRGKGVLLNEFPSPKFGTGELVALDNVLYGVYQNYVYEDPYEFDQILCAIDITTGTKLWEFPLKRYNFTYRIAVDRRMLVLYSGQFVLAIDPKTGTEVWRFDASALGTWREEVVSKTHEGRPTGTPIIYKDQVIVGISGNHFLAFDLATGAMLWDTPTEIPTPLGYSSTSDGRLYALNASRYYVIDAESGKKLFERNMLDELPAKKLMGLNGEIAVTDTHIYFSDIQIRKLAAMEKNTGDIVWSFQCDNAVPPWNVPVIANGRLYACDSKGTVYIFEEA